MKGFRQIIGSALVAAALAFGALPAAPASAQSSIPAFTAGFQVQNLGTTLATVSIEFYEEGATNPLTPITVTIEGSGQKTYATLSTLGVTSGFNGSAVLSSDQKIAAIVNLISPNLASLSLGSAYVGVSGGSLEVSLPLLFKNFFGFNSYFHVQNVGAAPASVTVQYNGTIGTSTTPVTFTDGPYTIQPGAAKKFDQSEIADASLADGFNGSATITSVGSEIAAVVNQVDASTSMTYNGFSSGSTAPVFPLVNTNNFGYVTGIALQNRGAVSSEVTITYTKSAGTSTASTCSEKLTIPSKGTKYFALEAFSATVAGEDCPNGTPAGSGTNSFIGSAKVTGNTGNVELVGIVNQLNRTTHKGGSYASFSTDAATDVVVFPLMQDRFFGYNTGISIINAGTVATVIRCTFTGSSYVTNPPTAFNSGVQTSSGAIPVGGAFTVVQTNALTDKFNGSGICTADEPTAKLVGIANQLNNATTVDTFFVYEGTNN